MKKLILCAILFGMGIVGPVYSEELIAKELDDFDSEEIVPEGIKNFLSDYLIARFSVYDNLERQKYNWGKTGLV